MQGLLIDLDGVLYQGDKVVDGAPEVVDWLNHNGIPHLFLTNTSSRPRSGILQKLGAMGIHTDESRIYTPVIAAAFWLRAHVTGPVAMFLPSATILDLHEFIQLAPQQEEGAEVLVVGDLGDEWDYPTINRAFRLLMSDSHPALIALGMTSYWLAEDGLRMDSGPFVKALEYAADCDPIVLGKPAKTFYLQALQILEVSAGHTLMIGDDIRGDVAGAQAASINGGLVKTGKFRAVDSASSIKPDVLLDSIADLPDWWEKNGD